LPREVLWLQETYFTFKSDPWEKQNLILCNSGKVLPPLQVFLCKIIRENLKNLTSWERGKENKIQKYSNHLEGTVNTAVQHFFVKETFHFSVKTKRLLFCDL